jgi:hypothetical protein
VEFCSRRFVPCTYMQGDMEQVGHVLTQKFGKWLASHGWALAPTTSAQLYGAALDAPLMLSVYGSSAHILSTYEIGAGFYGKTAQSAPYTAFVRDERVVRPDDRTEDYMRYHYGMSTGELSCHMDALVRRHKQECVHPIFGRTTIAAGELLPVLLHDLPDYPDPTGVRLRRA